MEQIKVLLFCGGPIHDLRAVGAELESTLAESGRFRVTRVDKDLDIFAGPGLNAYDVVVFYYTFGGLNAEQKRGLLNWVAGGKGLAGVHPAIGLESTPPDYQAFIGGWFLRHPPYRTYQVSVLDEAHPITEGLDEFLVADEQFIMDYDPRVHVLATALYKGAAHPVAWTKPWGKGRVFYLALGHDANACRNEHFKLMLTRGVVWAAAAGGQG